MAKLTKRTVDALKPKADAYFVWDGQVVGFGVRVMPSGTKTFQVQYRKGRRTRRSSLGRFGVVTVDQARDHAREMLGQVAGGFDPVEEIALTRLAPTVADLCERFLQVHVAVNLKPSTARDYRSTVKRMIRPALGTFKVAEVLRKDIADMHYRHRATPIQANRMLSVLSKMFNMAEMWGLRPDGSNPCRHVPKYKENRRERFLSNTELQTLGEVLTRCEAQGIETPHVVAAFRLLLLTGCRLSGNSDRAVGVCHRPRLGVARNKGRQTLHPPAPISPRDLGRAPPNVWPSVHHRRQVRERAYHRPSTPMAAHP